MPYRFDTRRRLEPVHATADLARGLRAEVADPLWFLGRQWQLGEHQGEDGGSPVRVEYRATQVPIRPFDNDPLLDPRLVPAEAIVEGEPDDFWTVGRRISIGRAVEEAAAAAGRPLPADDPELRLARLPVPYDVLDDLGFDGRVLFRRRPTLELPDEWFPELPPRSPRDLWNSAELAYDANFRAGPTTLTLRRHDGGSLDWWSVDATAPMPTPATPPAAVPVLPTRVQYPGAPNPRWWQLEESRTDIGAYAPDRGHFATLLLVELVSSHSGDWFTFPVVAQAGHVVTLHEVVVVDSFDEPHVLETPDDGWTLFQVTGLDQRSLVLWPTVVSALQGPVLDQADFGVDEDANLVWAVERRVAGRDLETPARPAAPPTPPEPTPQPGYTYWPGGEGAPHWHPYPVEASDTGPRRLIQGRLANLTRPGSRQLFPPPVSTLLRPTPGGGGGSIHRLDPAALPADGLQVERRHLLGRRTDGTPVLWQQRRRVPLTTPPSMRLQFDVLTSN